MVLRLLIDAVHNDETRVVIADNSRIHDFDFVTSAKKQVKGNIYLAKITRVEPSLQAAFVEYGGGKQGFLPFAEIHPDYYQIPMADRKRLLEEVEAEGDDEDDEDDANVEPASSTEPAEPREPSFTELMVQEGTQPLTFPAEASTPPDMQHEPVPAPVMASEHETPTVYSEQETPAFPPAEEFHAPSEASPDNNNVQDMPESRGEQQEIETIASEEETAREARPRNYSRRYKIQEVIKRNQIVLVQVIKEERGNKGVSLTTFISLAGRYCVLMPNSPKGGGISRKIASGEDRKRLKEISAELKTARGMSAIIRTAGIDRSRAEIKRDYEYLVKLWDSIREQTLSSTAPALIYEESDLIKRTLRDSYTTEIEEVVVEGEGGYTQAKEFLKMIMPSHAPKVKLYTDNVPLFYAYNIEDQLASMYDPVVKLRSGGYIVLSPTEALISIDVNSGRSTGERNIEETATKTNIEAAQEIARQLRLRDLAGLVVIDFIDMMDSRNRRAVERTLKEALKLDRAKIQIGRISPFGLLEMSRQRLRPSLSETSTMVCPHCEGRGSIRSDASVAIQLVRALEKEAASGVFSEVKATVSSSVALHLLNTMRDSISGLEKKYEVAIIIQADDSLAKANFRLEKVKAANARRVQAPAPIHELAMDAPIPEEELAVEDREPIISSSETREPREDSSDERPRRRGRRGGRGRNNRPYNDRPNGEMVSAEGEPAMAAEGTAPEGQQQAPREGGPDRGPRGPRRERGGRNRRGGRNQQWRDRRPNESGNGEAPREATQEQGKIVYPYQPSDGASQQPQQRMHAPRENSIPPLDQQGGDKSEKKGWWRRIVE